MRIKTIIISTFILTIITFLDRSNSEENFESIFKSLDKLEESYKEYQKYYKKEEKSKAPLYDLLKKFRFMPPDKHDHKMGTELILVVLAATANGKGKWFTGYGLAGVSMLNISVIDRKAYESLFNHHQSSKMQTSCSTSNNSSLSHLYYLGNKFSYPKTKSLITKREAVIHAVCGEIKGRFIYNNEGNFGRNYDPDPKRIDKSKKLDLLNNGLKLYAELKGQGLRDKALEDSLGILYALLDYDYNLPLLISQIEELVLLSPLQIYRDTLKAVLKRLNKNPKDHSLNILSELGYEMSSRGLAAHDPLLVLDNKEDYVALLKLVERDLTSIERKTS